MLHIDEAYTALDIFRFAVFFGAGSICTTKITHSRKRPKNNNETKNEGNLKNLNDLKNNKGPINESSPNEKDDLKINPYKLGLSWAKLRLVSH